jgi:hypothetical protein
VPADHKWFTRLVVAASMVKQLEAVNPKFPTLDEAALRDLGAVCAGLAGAQLAETREARWMDRS